MTLGQIVYSKSGRDAGKAFVVIDLEDEDYIFIADGDMRRYEKAKRKKVKHVSETGYTDQYIGTKLAEGSRVSNAELRKAVKEYLCGIRGE